MATRHYDWAPGEPPPVLGEHSIAKHKVLREYLQKYVSILASRPVQDQLKLTLVDGFSGGGAYLHAVTKERLPGSPLIMLEAMSAAGQTAKRGRRKQFNLDVEYFFVEKRLPTIDYLKAELRESREARAAGNRIQILLGSFSDYLETILRRVEERGRSRRVIFVLDQYGFTDVRMADLRTIFQRLPNAEVILTIAIDWLIDHWTENGNYDQILGDLGLDLEASFATTIKQSRPTDWRPVIQRELHHELFVKSGASFYTPFFIHSTEAHRAYWLLHFSGHSKARDVMMQLHWELQNHFHHFGALGLSMLGYDPRRDYEKLGQLTLPFGFDSHAAEEAKRSLLDELPRRIDAYKDGISFGGFFNAVVNETPATKDMIREQIAELTLNKELVVYSKDRKERDNGVRIREDDVILVPKHKKFSFPPQ